MSKFSLKSLLGIGGVGVAGAVSAGLYFGLGNSGTVNNSHPVIMQQVSSDAPEQVVDGISYSGEDGKDMPITVASGVNMTEELKQQLKNALERGDESDMDEITDGYDDFEEEGEWETVEETEEGEAQS